MPLSAGSLYSGAVLCGLAAGAGYLIRSRSVVTTRGKARFMAILFGGVGLVCGIGPLLFGLRLRHTIATIAPGYINVDRLVGALILSMACTCCIGLLMRMRNLPER